MQTDEKLLAFFENQIKPQLAELEAWRKNVLKKAVIFDAIFAPPFLVTVFFLITFMVKSAIECKTIADSIFMVFMVSFLSMIFFTPYIAAWRILRYKSKAIKTPEGYKIALNRYNELLYKNLAIGNLVKFISEDLSFNPERRKLSGEEVLKGEIFPHTIFYPEGFYAEDFIEGKISNINIRFFEISGKDALKPITKDSNGRSAIDLGGFPWETFSFYGMLGEVDFNKSFKGHTLVLPKARVRQSQWMRASGRERIRLEDPEFERYFSVFGADQITARYILSTALMKRITDYRKKIGRQIFLSFTKNKLHVAIAHRKDRFEFSMYRSLYDYNRIKGFFTDLTTITDIVEDLNLNRNIWLKDGKKEKDMFELGPNYKYKKEWVYKFLLYVFGYWGLHFLYIGYKLKALVYFIITTAFFYFLIFLVDGIISKGFYLFFFGILWYLYIWHKGHHIDRDSRGVRMEL